MIISTILERRWQTTTNLIRLDPSYAVIYGEEDTLDIPANLDEF